MKKIAIIQFPGSNCERETILAVSRAQMDAIPFLWNEPTEKLSACDGCIIVGGFSYEDRGRAGIIASLDPIMQTIRDMNDQGKPILGICNGAQMLVESGLVPGITDNKVVMALTRNKRIKDGHVLGTDFYNDWIFVKTEKNYPNNAFLNSLDPNQPIHIPAAHGEGRFVLANGLYDLLQQNNVGLLQYSDQDGNIDPEFPTNPNGSEENIAAICNASGNVMAIMPHPERTTNGDVIFESMRRYLEEKRTVSVPPLSFDSAKPEILPYQPTPHSLQLVVELIITDNTAASMQKALQNLGVAVQLKRQIHWEIAYKETDTLLEQKLIDSCELFNSSKERLIKEISSTETHTVSLLIRDKEDSVGQHKQEILRKHFDLKNISAIKRGVIWHISSEEGNIKDIVKMLIDKHILFNPYAHDCYTF